MTGEQGKPCIGLLADHTKHIPQLARWFYDQWRQFLPEPEKGIDQVLDSLRARLNTDSIPLALVLLDGETLLGSVSLKTHDMETRKDLSPWLAGLFVNPEYRGRGHGRLLVTACERKAVEMGITILYLFTPDAEDFYRSLGWSLIERTDYKAQRVTVMKKVL